jgi:O-antigen/teichoic acid export membrane protein
VSVNHEELPPSDALSRDELRRRASAGLFVVGSWGSINLVLGFVGSVALARLLEPRDFGIAAIGMTLLLFGNTLCDAGLGSGLIRRPEPPSRAELRSVVALQVLLASALALPAAAVALLFGEAGLVVTVMVLALPFMTLQTPGRIVLGRALLLRRVAVVDAAGPLVYYGWAIAGAAAGWGVWALATASVARVLAQGVVMVRLSGVGLVLPSLKAVRALRSVIAFGVRFQAVTVTGLIRDQGVNLVTGAIAGVVTLGLWTLVRRLLEVPLLLFEAVWRVSFPAMSQVLASKEDPAPLIRKSAALAPIASGLILTSLAAASPEFVPWVFGEQWREAAEVVPWACLALLLGGPVSVSTLGYLYAVGRPDIVLRAAVIHSVVWLAVMTPLLPVVGVKAIAIGWIPASLVDATIVSRATARLSGARIVGVLAVPILLATAAGAAGWAVTVAGGPGIVSAIQGGATAAALFIAALMVLRRQALVDTVAVVVRSARDAVSREAAPRSADAAPVEAVTT